MEKKSVIIVEDEILTAIELKFILEKNGINEIIIVSRGEEAVKMAVKIRPGLIFMDIYLKNHMDGIEATRKIHDCIDIPIVYITASTDKFTLKRARDTNPIGVVNKPYKENEIGSYLKKIFNK